MNVKLSLTLLSLFLLSVLQIQAQMQIGGQTLYGNEWIDYNQSYFKIAVQEDGIYRLDYATLNNAGVLSGTSVPQGSELKLYHNGKEVPLYVSTNGAIGSSDYIEFYGLKNRGEIDQHLYENPDWQLNPDYSFYTNVSHYFLTWNNNASERFENIANNITSGSTPAPFCWVEKSIVNSNKLYHGRHYGSGIYMCTYDMGEGYASSVFSSNQTVNIAVENLANTGQANLKTRILSGGGSHEIDLSINNNAVATATYNDWNVKQFNESVPVSFLTNGNNAVKMQGQSTDDKYTIVSVQLEYPRTFDFGNQNQMLFTLPAGEQYLEINNFNHGNQAPILYDITSKKRILTQLDGNTVKVALPSSTQNRKMVLIAQDAFNSTTSISSRNFTNYFQGSSSYDYIMLTHTHFLNDGNGNNIVQNYADYRTTPQGGAYTPLIVDVTQLYDQYGYGIARHEQSIKNFLAKATNAWSPKLLYIIGKGATYHLLRNSNSAWYQYDFVPSFGYPTSDHLFVTPTGSQSPSMGVGRIAAKNHADLQGYFDKVKEFESIQTNTPYTVEDRAWMKKVLHFGGGDINIQTLIEGELDALKDTLETSTMAAEVTTFLKNTDNTVADATEAIPTLNKGAAMLTFFGHSAPTTLDFDLGDPNEFQNYGKYPLFYAIGCNTNRIFETATSLSESYVFVENKGCIGFLGASWVTGLGSLSAYAKHFYSNIGTKKYGLSIGEALKGAIDDYSYNTSSVPRLIRNSVLLHGDPAVRLYPSETPDYIVDKEQSKIEPTIVNVQQDSFELNLVIKNLGKGVQDSFNVHLTNVLPNGSTIDLGTKRVLAPYYQSEYSIKLPVPSTNALGNNMIKVELDSEDEIQELPMAAETNNTAELPFFVVANDIFPIYPREFSIVPQQNITLKASTANVFSESLKYYFEIDTTEEFNSPLKLSSEQTSVGGIIEWTPSVAMIDSTVYYWRVSIDSTVIDGGFNWNSSSFVYIQDNPVGWNQSHYWQYKKDEFGGIKIGLLGRNDYENKSQTLEVQNGAVGLLSYIDIVVHKNGFLQYVYYPCPNDNVSQHRMLWATTYDPVKLEYSEGEHNDLLYDCFNNEKMFFIQGSTTIEQRANFIDYVQNVVPENHYVVFFTTQTVNNNYLADQWAADSITLGTNIFQVLEAQGATKVRDLATKQTPYIFIFQKDNPNFPVTEVHADSITQIITANTNLIGKSNRGSITSTKIGPAQEWETLLWQVSEYTPSYENVNIDVIGIDANGNETVVLDSIENYNYSLSSIDANQYPYIKLVYNTKDTVDYTTPQLDYWRVHYTPIAEAALVPNKHFSFHKDTLEQGEEFKLEIGIENVSDVDMDSLLMHYTVIDAQNNQVIHPTRMQPLLKQNMIIGKANIDTRNLLGENKIIIEANPNKDQPEQFHYNNVGVKSFFVNGDNRNPLLDVTFDGIHIMDGDIISSKPEIVVTLLDENPYLMITDTSSMRLFVKDPSGVAKEYQIDGDTMIFYPATSGGENKAKLEFRPQLLKDGTYELTVRGKDASGNQSGEIEYKVSFEVINEEKVSNVLVYPNPFSTSAQFVFTLTGDELPDVFRIQIMTVSGKVVKEIDLGDLGQLRIGNNITDYRWDGTDEYGDKLANGVYLYRVVAKKDGKTYGSFNNKTDKYFKNGFGKLVILR